MKTSRPVSKDCTACLLIGAINTIGGDQETANDDGGAERDRTADLMLAKHALSQLSYSPTFPPQKVTIAFRGPRGACGRDGGPG